MPSYIINLATREVIDRLQFPLLRTGANAGLQAILNGASAAHFKINSKNAWREHYDFNFGELPTNEEPQGVSVLGTPIYDKLVLKAGGIVFSDTPVMEANQMASLVIQKPIGYDADAPNKGSVKEDMGLDDVMVSIKGLLMHDEHTRLPYEALSALHNLFQKSRVVACESRYLQALGITQLVIQRFQVQPLEGYIDTFMYTLECLSDVPFDLEII